MLAIEICLYGLRLNKWTVLFSFLPQFDSDEINATEPYVAVLRYYAGVCVSRL